MSNHDQASAGPGKPAASFMIPMGSCPASFVELLNLSLEMKKGLTFYLPGQAIAGVVVKAAGDGTVELRSQQYSRIIVKLDDVRAVALG